MLLVEDYPAVGRANRLGLPVYRLEHREKEVVVVEEEEEEEGRRKKG